MGARCVQLPLLALLDSPVEYHTNQSRAITLLTLVLNPRALALLAYLEYRTTTGRLLLFAIARAAGPGCTLPKNKLKRLKKMT